MKKFVNPFIYLSGAVTMAWGAVGLMAMVVVAWYLGITFRGVVSEGIGSLSVWQLVLQQVAGWGIFAILLYVSARLLSKSKIRVVDIFGNQLMARMPLILILLGTTLVPIRKITDELKTITPDQLASNPELFDSMNTISITLFGVAAILVLVWFFAWSYQGYAVAANLKGGKAAASYIACYLLAEVAALWCTAAIGNG